MKSLSRAIAAAVGSLALTIVPAQTLAQSGTPVKEESSIAVSGTAKVYRSPDFVDIMAGVEVYEKTASAASAGATSTMAKVVAAIKDLRLDGQDLQTGSVDLSPRYDDHRTNGEDPRKIIGYQATLTLRIRTSDTAAVSKAIDASLGAGANRIEYVQFGIKEALEAREEAIRLASKAAKRKASVMAESLDLRLGRIIHASANSVQSGWWGANRYSSNMMAQVSGGQAAGGSDDSEAVVPGKIEVWAEVSITVGVDPATK
jgi:uncharacterized protein YggE